MADYKMVATTLSGFEELLAGELLKLGAKNIVPGVRSVSFTGDKGFMYKANLSLRTAIKILKPISVFEAADVQQLYDGVRAVDWSQYMIPQGSLAVDAAVSSDIFTHSLFVAQKAKDAIVDQFREKSGIRPDVDLKLPDLRINIHIRNTLCTLSIDSSGASLHKRGYKTAVNEAPISEVLAAGLIMHSGWDGSKHFLDPMCGSGTLLIEAAMIAANIPPNIHRADFAFMGWPDMDEALFEKIKISVMSRVKDVHCQIVGRDINSDTLAMAQENIENAGLEDFITLEQADFFDTSKNITGPLHVLFNPPYDERLSVDVETFYKNIGDSLKKNYAGTEAWFVSGNLEAIKHVGLKASRRIPVMNGALDARLVKYELYEGTRRKV